MSGSWKTTLTGALGLLVIVAGAAQEQLENGNSDWKIILLSIITAIGLYCSRDKNVSSEEQRGSKKVKSKIIPVLLMPLLFIGCSTASSTPDLINDAKEENSGWTDADNRDIRIIINGSVANSSIDLWVETTSGNAREGRGSAGENTTGNTDQKPVNEVPIEVPINIAPAP